MKETGVDNLIISLNCYTVSHVTKLCNVNIIFIAILDQCLKSITLCLEVNNHSLANYLVQTKVLSFISRNSLINSIIGQSSGLGSSSIRVTSEFDRYLSALLVEVSISKDDFDTLG